MAAGGNWPRDREWPADWQSKDVADVLWAIGQIPESLWPQRLWGIYRLQRSRDYPNPGLYLDGNIVLYDTAFQHESYAARVLAHELAHARFRGFSGVQRLAYQKATRWHDASRHCLKEECQESVDEDFANSAEFYIFEPDTLKNASPESYVWMEKFIGKISAKKGQQ